VTLTETTKNRNEKKK